MPAEPRSIVDIERIALRIIKKYQPNVLKSGHPFDTERFFECNLESITGVSYDYQVLPNHIYGFTDSEEMVSVISLELVENEWQEKFRRSTTSHEIGHAILHVNDYRRKKAILKSTQDNNHNMRLYREEEIITYQNPEWQAWIFAQALLMPFQEVQKVHLKGLTVFDMSDRFVVNPAFVKSRLRRLKLSVK